MDDESRRSMTPRRVQLSRKPGWRKPPGAVVVSRPTRWGNPYPVATFGRDQAVALFRRYLAEHPELVEAARQELAGKDLACWCRPGELCHADIWLEIANGKDPGKHEPAGGDTGDAEGDQAWVGLVDTEDRPAGQLTQDQQPGST
jgi:Domain of unknown function (DUF4326)